MYIEVSGRSDDRWAQIGRDLVAPAPKTDWARRVAETRIRYYDRVRPFVTRGALLAVVVLTAAVLPGTRWWAWAAFVPAAVQVFLELVLERLANNSREPKDLGPLGTLRPAVHLLFTNHEVKARNFTGMLGVPAVALLVLGQMFGTGPAGAGWVKFVGTAAALLYTSSGLLGPVVDVVTYSPMEESSRLEIRTRPLWWLAVCVAAAGVFALSVEAGTWASGAVGYAAWLCLIPAAIGYRTREYERAVDAAGRVAVGMIDDSNRQASQELHDIVQPFKQNIEDLIPSFTSPVQKAEMVNFFAVMRAVLDRVRDRRVSMQAGVLPTMNNVVLHAFGSVTLDPPPVVDLRLEQMDELNQRLAQQVATTLAYNAAQAYARRPNLTSRPITVRGYVEADVARIEVTDAMEPIPAQVWANPKGTLAAVRAALEVRGGTLEQHPSNAGGKTIVAEWHPDVRRLRDQDDAREEQAGPDDLEEL